MSTGSATSTDSPAPAAATVDTSSLDQAVAQFEQLLNAQVANVAAYETAETNLAEVTGTSNANVQAAQQQVASANDAQQAGASAIQQAQQAVDAAMASIVQQLAAPSPQTSTATAS